jgi:hypothetical protein
MLATPLVTGLLAAMPLALPTGAASTCSYDTATATVQAQMLSTRTVISRGGDRVLVDGRACGALATTKQIVVSSDYPPAKDTVVVDESHGRLADAATGSRPEVVALTGFGDDTMEVIGTSGADRYVAHDDLGASIDLDGDDDPDFTSTHVGRVVLMGGPGNDFLQGGRHDLLIGGPGHDRIRRQP